MSVLPIYRYSINNIESILAAGFQPKLMQSIIDIINTLDAELQVPEEIPTTAVNTSSVGHFPRKEKALSENTHHHGSQGQHGGKNKYGNAKKNNRKQIEVSAEEWDSMIAASSVIKRPETDGLEKELNNIRIFMNKISTKNYDTQHAVITDSIRNYMINANESKEEVAKLFQTMMGIIGTNKFFSELYANLFKEWFVLFPVLMEHWIPQMEQCKHSIDDIRSIDPNVDYDGYCNYTKINDKRRAYTTFIANLSKKNVISEESVCNLLSYYLQKTIEYIDEKGRSNEVEEITENVHILTSIISSNMANNDTWKTYIVPTLIQISQMKMKEHASLTNRVVFKYMDIIDTME